MTRGGLRQRARGGERCTTPQIRCVASRGYTEGRKSRCALVFPQAAETRPATTAVAYSTVDTDPTEVKGRRGGNLVERKGCGEHESNLDLLCPN